MTAKQRKRRTCKASDCSIRFTPRDDRQKYHHPNCRQRNYLERNGMVVRMVKRPKPRGPRGLTSYDVFKKVDKDLKWVGETTANKRELAVKKLVGEQPGHVAIPTKYS